MAETIGSLGGVPLGRAGTGTAVILGEKDYSYLKPKEEKKEKYKPLIGDDEIGKLIKDAGALWKPDQQRGGEKVNEIITKIKQMEILNKSGEKESAKKMYDEIQQDVLKFGNFVKNSNDAETSGKSFETDYRNNSILYTPAQWDEYEQWKLIDADQRPLSVPVEKASNLNYVPLVMRNMKGLMKPSGSKIVTEKGGWRNSQTKEYFDEEQVRDVAMKSAFMTPENYLNLLKKQMMDKQVIEDPDTPESEVDRAAQIIASLGPDGRSPELFDFIAGQNYLLFTQNMEKISKESKPATPRRTGGGGGGRKSQETVSISHGQYNGVITDPTTGAKIASKNIVYKTSLGTTTNKQLPFVVSTAYLQGYANQNPKVKPLIEVAGDEKLPSQISITGSPRSIVYDPSTGYEYLSIATEIGDDEEFILIPYNQVENQSTMEALFMGTKVYKQNGTTLRQYLDNYYKTPMGTPTTNVTPPPSTATPPAGGGGAPPAGGGGNADKWINKHGRKK